MILNQPDFFARAATLDGAIADTDTQITLTGLSSRFTDAVAAGTVRYPIGPLRISDDDGFELIAITGHVSGTTFEVERGIQGTTAEAWPDGTAVRAVVTSRHTGLYPVAVASPVPKPICADTFQRSDRGLDGDRMPTGGVWSTPVGVSGFDIVDGSARPIATPAFALFTGDSGASRKRSFRLALRNSSSSSYDGIVVLYQDADNYVSVGLGASGRRNLTIIQVKDSVYSELSSSTLGETNNFLDQATVIDVFMNDSNGGRVAAACAGVNISAIIDSDIRSASQGYGLYAESSSIIYTFCSYS